MPRLLHDLLNGYGFVYLLSFVGILILKFIERLFQQLVLPLLIDQGICIGGKGSSFDIESGIGLLNLIRTCYFYLILYLFYRTVLVVEDALCHVYANSIKLLLVNFF